MIADDPACVIHLGWPKCGSSALQQSLSAQPVLDAGYRRYEYVAIGADGGLLRGGALQEAAAVSATGYINSALAPRGGEAHAAPARAELAALREGGIIPILSNEIWGPEVSILGSLVEAAPASVLAVAYVRPHVELVNSAWWQWGAWGDSSFDDWLAGWLECPPYVSGLDRWAAHPAVARLVVKPLPTDVVADFTTLLGGAGRYDDSRRNRGPGATLLRLLQRHRELRPVHMPDVDFVVERALGEMAEGRPWVLDRDNVERVLASHRDDVRVLQGLMDSSDSAAVDADPRWWDASAYADRVVEPADGQPPVGEEMDDFAAALLRGLLDLESELRGERSRRIR